MTSPNWFSIFCDAIEQSESHALGELKKFNKSLSQTREHYLAINPKTINNWRANHSTTPNMRTATFLKEFLRENYGHQENKEFSEITQYLDRRIEKNRPNRKIYSDPFSLVAEKHLPKDIFNQRDIRGIVGNYRLVRYNSVTGKMVSDYIKISFNSDDFICHLVTENEDPYKGKCYVIRDRVFFFFVSERAKNTEMGYSIRNLMFQTPISKQTNTIVGLMMRTSSTKGNPLASMVILDKIVKSDNISKIDRMIEVDAKWFSGRLTDNQIIGKVPFSHPHYHKYQKLLMNRGGEYIPPLEPYDLKRVQYIFG